MEISNSGEIVRFIYKKQDIQISLNKISLSFCQDLKISQKEQSDIIEKRQKEEFENFKKHQEDQNLKVIESLKLEIQVRTELLTKVRYLMY